MRENYFSSEFLEQKKKTKTKKALVFTSLHCRTYLNEQKIPDSITQNLLDSGTLVRPALPRKKNQTKQIKTKKKSWSQFTLVPDVTVGGIEKALIQSWNTLRVVPWGDTNRLNCKYPRESHTIYCNDVTVNCMGLSRILTVQAIIRKFFTNCL